MLPPQTAACTDSPVQVVYGAARLPRVWIAADRPTGHIEKIRTGSCLGRRHCRFHPWDGFANILFIRLRRTYYRWLKAGKSVYPNYLPTIVQVIVGTPGTH